MKFYSILVVTLGAANYATADDGINMLRGMLPNLKKMKDDAGVVDVLADDKEEGALSLIEEVIPCGEGNPCDPDSNKPHCCPNPNPNGPDDICMTHAPES